MQRSGDRVRDEMKNRKAGPGQPLYGMTFLSLQNIESGIKSRILEAQECQPAVEEPARNSRPVRERLVRNPTRVEIFFKENGVGLRPSEGDVMTLSNRLDFSSAFVLYPQADPQSQGGKRRNRGEGEKRP
ncbi:hypothetical protein EAG_09117 [Camponotus floridanus]|uniref:Uncharacterized protein n=1 Tax=Camponotus floridanus TaxID=104421 RepID=E2AHC6_CAMFO|nr:hypothetical protein EAG_09117 [Camponotus floridanus]